MKKTTVLIIEDEAAIREMLKFTLLKANLAIFEAEDVKQAEKFLTQKIPDIILLDWMLPNISGIEWLYKLKRSEIYQYIPVILLTARAEEENKIKGLETGADDYITKPFSPRELLARIKNILRRGVLATPENVFKIGELTLDANLHQVFVREQLIKLKPLEYRLLHFFMTHPEHVYNRHQLLNYVWGTGVFVDDRTVDVQVRRLRKALSAFDYDKLLHTIHGIGYKFSKHHEK